jgi:hypothetical protein
MLGSNINKIPGYNGINNFIFKVSDILDGKIYVDGAPGQINKRFIPTDILNFFIYNPDYVKPTQFVKPFSILKMPKVLRMIISSYNINKAWHSTYESIIDKYKDRSDFFTDIGNDTGSMMIDGSFYQGDGRAFFQTVTPPRFFTEENPFVGTNVLNICIAKDYQVAPDPTRLFTYRILPFDAYDQFLDDAASRMSWAYSRYASFKTILISDLGYVNQYSYSDGGPGQFVMIGQDACSYLKDYGFEFGFTTDTGADDSGGRDMSELIFPYIDDFFGFNKS